MVMDTQDNGMINDTPNVGARWGAVSFHIDAQRHSPLPSLSSRKQTKPIPGSELQVDIGVIRVPSGSGFRIMTPFPWRLHEMLEDIHEKNLHWIVAWMPDGKVFQVLNQTRFEDTILPMYFRHNRYKSFQVSFLQI
jgi:hypothetical protein